MTSSCGISSSEKSRISSEKSMVSGEISKFFARCQSRFDDLRKSNGVLRNNIIGVFALFGTKADISTEISIDSAEMSKEN